MFISNSLWSYRRVGAACTADREGTRKTASVGGVAPVGGVSGGGWAEPMTCWSPTQYQRALAIASWYMIWSATSPGAVAL